MIVILQSKISHCVLVRVRVRVSCIGNGTDGQGNQLGLIIGASVGGCAFLGIISLCFVRRQKRVAVYSFDSVTFARDSAPENDLARTAYATPYIPHTNTAELETYVSGVGLVYAHEPATDVYYRSEPDEDGFEVSV
jgi:hypothetical protein